MAQAKPKNTNPPISKHIHRGLREGALYLLIAIAIVFMLALLTYDSRDPGWSHVGPREYAENLVGPVGAWFADVFLYWFGYMAFLVPVMVGYSAWLIIRKRTADDRFDGRLFAVRWTGFIVMVISGCGLAAMHFAVQPGELPGPLAGGILGREVGNAGLAQAMNVVGATVVLLAFFLASITLFTGISWLQVIDVTGKYSLKFYDWSSLRWKDFSEKRHEKKEEQRVKQERKEMFEVGQKKEVERKISTLR